MSHTRLYEIYFMHLYDGMFMLLTVLKKLDLYNNDISVIESNAFSGLSSVEELNLGNNNISLIKPNAFSGLIAMTQLWLFDNQLESLEFAVFNHKDFMSTGGHPGLCKS